MNGHSADSILMHTGEPHVFEKEIQNTIGENMTSEQNKCPVMGTTHQAVGGQFNTGIAFLRAQTRYSLFTSILRFIDLIPSVCGSYVDGVVIG